MSDKRKQNVALRAFNIAFRRHDPERRPEEAFWFWIAVGAIVVLGGVAGYAVPAAITWWDRAPG